MIPGGLQPGQSPFHFGAFSTTNFTGVSVADLTSLGYQTYVTSNAGNDAPYLALRIDYGARYREYDFVPDADSGALIP